VWRQVFASGSELEADFLAAKRLTHDAAGVLDLDPSRPGQGAHWEDMMLAAFVMFHIIEIERLLEVDRRAGPDGIAREIPYAFDVTRWAVARQGAKQAAVDVGGELALAQLNEDSRLAVEVGSTGLFWWLAGALDRPGDDPEPLELRLKRATRLLRRWLPGGEVVSGPLARYGVDSLIVFTHLTAIWYMQPSGTYDVDYVVDAYRRCVHTLSAPAAPDRDEVADRAATEFRRFLETARDWLDTLDDRDAP
jgi:hypothetical protein